MLRFSGQDAGQAGAVDALFAGHENIEAFAQQDIDHPESA